MTRNQASGSLFDAAFGVAGADTASRDEWVGLIDDLAPDWRLRDGNTTTWLPATGKHRMVGDAIASHLGAAVGHRAVAGEDAGDPSPLGRQADGGGCPVVETGARGLADATSARVPDRRGRRGRRQATGSLARPVARASSGAA